MVDPGVSALRKLALILIFNRSPKFGETFLGVSVGEESF